jgi:hypothetical protein
MNIIPSSRRRHYVVKVGIFLLVLAFTAGMVGCDCVYYELTIASIGPGSVTIPAEGVFTYGKGEMAGLVATPDSNCHFVSWTGDVVDISNVNAPITDITVNGDYTIIANFEEDEEVDEYYLYVFSSGPGAVTAPEASQYTWPVGAVVDLVATPDAGYRFIKWTGDVDTIIDVNDATTQIAMYGFYWITANFGTVITRVVAGKSHTVGLEDDGTVVAVGDNSQGQRDVLNWTGIVQVGAGGYHTVGLKTDGTVFAVGLNSAHQCDVGSWASIIQVAAGYGHTVGLEDDGTVVAEGSNSAGQCDVTGWASITQIAAGYGHTVGLEDDGTVVAVGDNGEGQRNVLTWTGITQVTAGGYHTVGLESDGTVVAVGDNSDGQRDVLTWTGIVQVAAGGYHTVGLKADGTVAATGLNDDHQCDVTNWKGTVQIAAGEYHTVGLKADGTVVATGLNDDHQCDVIGWTGIT